MNIGEAKAVWQKFISEGTLNEKMQPVVVDTRPPRAGMTQHVIHRALVPAVQIKRQRLLAAGDAWGEGSTEALAALVGYTPSGMAAGWEWSALLPDYSAGSLPGWVGYLLSAVIGVSLLVIVFRLLAGTARRDVDFG